ncbi:F-box/FBD/LRR-repeat protein At1g13570-like [Phoenix dactylifera]|uniref:F-box/FBD/LRR-repeat protein At1g13570-like n=1 Tax=Phoenix dactylifera TaxID=42345 RepID=A0A8B7MRS8_PHODC|nr:F-box/FBD/LRR-repeat protein At1g13570-like [Phoenix dactylifera]
MALTAEMPPEKKTTSRQEEDRISQLPEEILLLILSHLSMESAAATTILSKRWRHLFYFLPCLKIASFYDRGRSSPDSVAREFATIFDVLRSRRCPLKCCELSISFREQFDGDMHRIMHLLCEDGLEDLSIANYGKDPYRISSHMFSCRTINSLYLYKCSLSAPSDFTGLRSLRTLELDDVVMTDEQFEMMVSGCWALENLIVYNGYQVKNLVICSRRLSRLEVITHRPLGILVEEAPCLDSVSVSYSYHEADLYWKDVANTEFYHPEGEIVESDSEDSEDSEDEEVSEINRFLWLLVGLGHTKTLKLVFDTEAAECLEFQGLLLVSLPSKHRLIQLKKLDLKMHFNGKYLASILVSLLNGSPNLQELTVEIDKFHVYTEIVEADYWDKQIPSECVQNRLKTATLIFYYRFVEDCIGFPKFLLMNACALEKMSINYTLKKKEKPLFSRFQEELFSLQKASPDAVLELTPID